MEFYTSVSRLGSSILYRGYRDGIRVHERVKFKPTLYLPSQDEHSEWKAMDGSPVEPKLFESISDASNFLKQYEGVPSFRVYGNARWIQQFIQHKFPDEIKFDRDVICVSMIDIEVNSDDGFPKPEEAVQEILSIGIKSSKEEAYRVWGLKAYDPSLSGKQVEYKQFRSEKEMLMDFVSWWATPSNTPDVISGWNSRFFDITYLCNRILRVLGAEVLSLLSPWGKVEKGSQMVKGRELEQVDIMGVAQLDFMDLFMKFTPHTYGNQESYKLGHIANVVLGETKVDYKEFGSLSALYEKDHQKFIDYMIRDVELVERMEDKLGLVTLALTLSYMGGVNFSDSLGTVAIWDSIIHRYLSNMCVAIPQPRDNAVSQYPGGYVKEVVPGMYDWVCNFDLNSLYPNLIVQYNISPEKILPESDSSMNPEKILAGDEVVPMVPGAIVAANGAHFRSDSVGVLPSIVKEIYDKRVTLKKAMIERKKEQEMLRNELKEIQRMTSKVPITDK